MGKNEKTQVHAEVTGAAQSTGTTADMIGGYAFPCACGCGRVVGTLSIGRMANGEVVIQTTQAGVPGKPPAEITMIIGRPDAEMVATLLQRAAANVQ